MSDDQVARLCPRVDEQIRIFRERPLASRYLYLRLDGKIEKVSERRRARQNRVVVANAVHESGRRAVMAKLDLRLGRLRDTPDIGPRRAIALGEPAHRYASADRAWHLHIAERALDLPQTLDEQPAAIISEGLANLLGHTRGSAGTVCSCDDGATNPTEPRFGFGFAGLRARALTIGASPTFEPGAASGLAAIVSWTAAAR